VPFVTQQLDKHTGPVVASTDYMKAYAEQIRALHPKGRAYKVLGTDGFWPQRFPQQAARALRGQPPLHRGGRAEGAEPKRAPCPWPRWPRRSPSTASTPTRSTRCTPDGHTGDNNMALVEVKVPDIGDFDEVAVIELMVKPGDTVQRRAKPDHRGVRQGLDGDPVQSHAGVVKELKVAAGRQGQAKARWC